MKRRGFFSAALALFAIPFAPRTVAPPQKIARNVEEARRLWPELEINFTNFATVSRVNPVTGKRERIGIRPFVWTKQTERTRP